MLVEYESKTINNLTFEAIGWKVEVPGCAYQFFKNAQRIFLKPHRW